jgi:hypothetical protein
MATYTDIYTEGKLNEEAVGLTAGESDSTYQSPDLSNTRRIKKKRPNEMSAAE